ncbi:MAG: MaoC family dehydratase N-terminal domain-containing protein [Ktedonobacteraceae bacterium]|nr:MaoC family dehydratase N-terminal domain-containing protein [Ktedonobacteraceae bacterium]
MPFDSSLIGKSSEPRTFEVREEAVRRFMEADGDPALQSGAPIQYAPPTFPTTFRIGIPGVELDGSKMQLIHGEQSYSYTRRLRVGEQVTCTSRIEDIRERSGKSGSMTIVISETSGVDQEQQQVFTARSTLIVRQK